MHREHPIKILRYCIKNLWLLVFPLLRSSVLMPFSPDALLRWLHGAWFDILIFLLILGLAFLRWRCCVFSFCREYLRCRSGVFFRRYICIPCSRMTAVTETDACLLRPLGLILLKIDTGAAPLPASELRLWLREKHLHQMRKVIPVMQPSASPAKRRRTSVWMTLLFSFLFSSSLSGTVYIITFFVQAGTIARDLFLQLQIMKALDEINSAAIRTFYVIPSVIVSLCVFLGACWTISFFANLLHYGRFRVHASTELLSVSMGILIRRRTHLRPGAVNYVILRQNLMMKLFGVQSMHLSCPGYGSGRKSLPVLIPVLTKKTAPLPLSALMPDVQDRETPKAVQALRHGVWSFVWLPVTLIGGIFAVLFMGTWAFPDIGRLLFFAAVLGLVPAVWLLFIRLISIPAEFVGIDDKQIQLHYRRGFSFYTITAPVEHVNGVKICRTPMTARNDVCNLIIQLKGHRRKRHKITGVSYKQARALQKLLTQ